MNPDELAYDILKDACKHLMSRMSQAQPPTPAEAHCFIILWQAQCAIIHHCDIYDNEAIQANLATSHYAVKGDSVISLDLDTLIRRQYGN